MAILCDLPGDQASASAVAADSMTVARSRGGLPGHRLRPGGNHGDISVTVNNLQTVPSLRVPYLEYMAGVRLRYAGKPPSARAEAHMPSLLLQTRRRAGR